MRISRLLQTLLIVTMLVVLAAPARATPANGTYTGTIATGGTVTIVVSGGQVTSFSVSSYTSSCGTLGGSFGPCSTIGDNFTCGQTFCAPDGVPRLRAEGTFAGSDASGTIDLSLQGPVIVIPPPCCTQSNVAWSASSGGGGGGGAPDAPSGLTATATSDDAVGLDWNDNSDDESEFRVELRQGTVGSFVDVGGVGANARAATVSGLDPATLYQFRLRARNANGSSPYSNTASATTFGGSGDCVPSATAMCLNGDRFRVHATFDTGEHAGAAQVVELTSDTGYLWFFADTNVELIVKVLDACGFNDRYWVFMGGLTNVNTVITVTDTETGASKTYTNPQGTAFKPIQDTGAFATCL